MAWVHSLNSTDACLGNREVNHDREILSGKCARTYLVVENTYLAFYIRLLRRQTVRAKAKDALNSHKAKYLFTREVN